MPIERIEIKNCKSIKNLQISFTHLNCFLGENGVGKTNIMKAIKYFYDNLNEKQINNSLFDKTNPYIDTFEISFYYDFSRLNKIADSHIQRNHNYDYKLNPIFKNIKKIFTTYKNSSNEVKVTLVQDRNGIVSWNIPFNVRTFIKNIFPIYFAQTRHLDLLNWDELWGIIGELSKAEIANNTTLNKILEECFKEAFGERYLKILNFIEKEFNSNNIEVTSFNSKQKFANIYQLQMGGKEFKHKFENLNFFSDGVNSFNYLKLLVNLVSKISELKIKEPTIVIDEPEIGLHPKFLDDLVDIFLNKSTHIKIIFSTHSPRIIKNLTSHTKVNLFHISINNRYTYIKKMRGFTDNREMHMATEQEASYYFSKSIVFVEGVTEIELFSNKNLLALFPFLNDVQFYSFDGNTVKIKAMHPGKKNLSIPYLVIADLDKILEYNPSTSRFVIKKGEKFTNPLMDKETKKREILFYGKKKINTYYRRKRINGIIDKSKFHFDYWGNIKGDIFYFDLLRKLIQKYSLEYNIYPVTTTIEGTLINTFNHKIVFEWLKNYKNKNSHQIIINDLYNLENNISNKTTILRLIVNGKFDTLETVKLRIGTTENIVNAVEKSIFEKIDKIKIGKTNGWVTNFINYFFENNINIVDLTHEKKMSIFKKNFPEIYIMITSIKNMVKNE